VHGSGVLLLPTSDPNSVGVVPTPRSDQEAALLKYGRRFEEYDITYHHCVLPPVEMRGL